MTTLARARRLPRRSAVKLIALLASAALAVAGCASVPVRPQIRGTVLFSRIPGTVSTISPRPTTIYLPPGAAGRSLPVLELLHDPLNGSSSWLHVSGLKAIATIFAAAHHGISPIIVMPGIRRPKQPGNGCVTPSDRRHAEDFERYLVDDVPNYVRAHYGASTDRQDWTIAGLASQGTYAVMLALRHPDVFGNFADLSGRARPAEPSHRPAWLLAHRSYPATSGWFESGRHDDGAIRTQDRLASLSQTAGISVHAATVTGANGWTAWRTSLRRLLPWALDRAVPRPATTSAPASTHTAAPTSARTSTPSGAAPRSSPTSRLSSGHVPALRRSRSVDRLPQCAPGHRGRGTDHRGGHPKRAHRSA